MSLFDGLGITQEEMIDFSSRVDTLNADIASSADKIPPFSEDNPSDNQEKFAIWHVTQWLPWYGSWMAWAIEHQSNLSRIQSSVVVEFGKWNSDYNLLLRQFKRFGGSTALTEVPTLEAPEPVEEDEEPWYETVTDSIGQNIMITSVLGIAMLLGYYHVTKGK